MARGGKQIHLVISCLATRFFVGVCTYRWSSAIIRWSAFAKDCDRVEM